MKNQLKLAYLGIAILCTMIISGCGAVSQAVSGTDSSATAQGLTSLQAQGGDKVTINDLLWSVADAPSSVGVTTVQPSTSQNNGTTTTHTFTISDSDLGAVSTGGSFQFTVQVAN